jgi:hypothetical protein
MSKTCQRHVKDTSKTRQRHTSKTKNQNQNQKKHKTRNSVFNFFLKLVAKKH